MNGFVQCTKLFCNCRESAGCLNLAAMQPSNSEREQRANQRARLLELLKRTSPDWVPIREVLNVAGFQYGARIFELRHLGHHIENDPGRAFRLITVARAKTENSSSTEPEDELQQPATLFGDLQPEPRYPD